MLFVCLVESQQGQLDEGNFHMMKVFYIYLCFLLIACGDIPKEGDGTEKVQVNLELKYDNKTKRLGPLLEYIELEY